MYLRSSASRYELNIKSAHRTLAAAQAYIADAERRGCAVFITAAGLAAAGVRWADLLFSS